VTKKRGCGHAVFLISEAGESENGLPTKGGFVGVSPAAETACEFNGVNVKM
jgi:hypothetical protein